MTVMKNGQPTWTTTTLVAIILSLFTLVMSQVLSPHSSLVAAQAVDHTQITVNTGRLTALEVVTSELRKENNVAHVELMKELMEIQKALRK